MSILGRDNNRISYQITTAHVCNGANCATQLRTISECNRMKKWETKSETHVYEQNKTPDKYTNWKGSSSIRLPLPSQIQSFSDWPIIASPSPDECIALWSWMISTVLSRLCNNSQGLCWQSWVRWTIEINVQYTDLCILHTADYWLTPHSIKQRGQTNGPPLLYINIMYHWKVFTATSLHISYK